jgi:hypothetical protein
MVGSAINNTSERVRTLIFKKTDDILFDMSSEIGAPDLVDPRDKELFIISSKSYSEENSEIKEIILRAEFISNNSSTPLLHGYRLHVATN